LDNAQTWSQWVHPWVTSSGAGYSSWVGENPKVRELVLALNLIPRVLQNTNNPLNWERACDLGRYNAYATQLGQSLVAAGLQYSVLRLGPEMNGTWEADFIGATKTEQRRWASCFVQEVTSLRSVAGEHFLIDWNPNACVGNYSYANFYPGNKFVDIVGLDIYDEGCLKPDAPLTFKQLASERLGLKYFVAFAKSKDKPMSLPEWGLSSIPSGDDPAYINGIGATVASNDFAFETYFDGSGTDVKALNLGPGTPLSLAAFQQWFGSNQ
jgi:beta-mannanase